MPTLTTLTLNAAVTGTHGWTCGHAFKKGDLPAGQTLSGLQLVIKNYWPDGSAKFGLLAGQTAITSGSPATVTLQTGSAATGASLSITDLKATGVTASIDCGGFGSASWAGAEWDSPLEVWFAGPMASSWRYRKAVGSDPHLSAWLEVTLFANGSVEVLPWIENSTILTAGITNKIETFGFTLGGSARFSLAIDLPNRCRTPLLSGTALSYYLGSDPGLSFRHNAAYFSASKLIPAYSATVPDSSVSITGLPTTFTPLQQGSYPAGMGAAGYHSSIGILPGFDVTYVTNSTSPLPWAALQRNAYSAGRYGLHWRDTATNLPAQFASYPTYGLGSGSGVSDIGGTVSGLYFTSGTGTAPATWKQSHCPAVGYLAYLVTGRKYHLETVQFAATTNHFRAPNAYRQSALGIQRTDEASTRGAAWCLRTLAHAASATPDDQTALKNQFVSTLANNANWYHGQYIAQPGNPQGFTKELEVNGAPYNDAYTPNAGPYTQAPWMHAFFNAAVGMWKTLEITLGGGADAKFDAFYTWKAQSTVGLFGAGGATEFLYRDAGLRALAVAPADTADWNGGTGPWFANWGEMYFATFVDNVSEPGLTYGTAYTATMIYLNGAKPSKVVGDGSLRGQEGIADATGLWGDIQPALAYAVSNGISGAQAAWDRMTTAPNYSSFLTDAANHPVWAVTPFAGSAPATLPQGQSIVVGATPLVSGAVVVGVAGHGVLGGAVPATGADGASLIYDKLVLPYDATVEVRIVVTAVSSGLLIQADENGAATITVPGDGSHWIDTTTYKAGAEFLSERHYINVGVSAPVLSAATGTAVGATSSSGSVTTDKAGGTLYRLTTVNASETISAIKAGASQAVVSAGVQSVSASGLTPSTTYRHHFVHTDAFGVDSNPISSATFTTAAATSAPVFSAQPTTTPVVAPAIATISYTISGTGVTVQAYRNGAPVSGATLTEFVTGATSVSGGSANNGDVYTFVATNAGGSITSSPVTLAVGSGTIPLTFSGPIPNQTATIGVPFSLDLSQYFTGSWITLSYAIVSGGIPGNGLSLSGSVISGTPTSLGSIPGIQARATDTTTAQAFTNSFSITVAAEVIPLRQISPIPDLSIRAGVPFSYDLAPHFQTSSPPISYQVAPGTYLPRGISLVGSVISGTAEESAIHVATKPQIIVSDAG